MPDRTTHEKKYLGECYQDSLGDKPIWVGVDETTDAMARYVANVLIGRLDNEKYHTPCLANVVFLEKTNSATISRLVNNTLKFLCNFDADLLKLLLSDVAAYKLKSGREQKVFYPTLLHITCLAHGLHRVCESVREMFPEVNDLVSTVKGVFVKVPSRIIIWKEVCPEVPLPPEPMLTRWGTWIDAALFYAKKIEKVKTVASQLSPEDAAAIGKCQKLLKNHRLASDLVFIAGNLAFLPAVLTRLEEAGLPLERAVAIFDEAKSNFDSIAGQKGLLSQSKFKSVLERNSDVLVLRSIVGCLKGEEGSLSLPEGFGPGVVPNFKFCPTANVDVERIFFGLQNCVD